MPIEGWKYYNHAMITTGGPGAKTNLDPIVDGSIWKNSDGYPLFCRYVSNYDCGFPTEWWYCLKDDEYDLTLLKSKKRYRINKGRKNFLISIENEKDIIDELVIVISKAYESYPNKYRPNSNFAHLHNLINQWDNQEHKVFVARKVSDNSVAGYALINEYDNYYYYAQQKAIPYYEKDEINAALVDGVLQHYKSKINKDHPLVDGQRNIVHETSFQDYLCSVFGFRKAYCQLNIVYRPWVHLLVNCLYPMRNKISSMEGNIAYQISSVLKMEEICKSFE